MATTLHILQRADNKKKINNTYYYCCWYFGNIVLKFSIYLWKKCMDAWMEMLRTPVLEKNKGYSESTLLTMFMHTKTVTLLSSIYKNKH